MEKSLEKILNAIVDSDKPLTKIEINSLEGRANRSKLRLLLKDGIIKRNKVIVPVNPKDLELILEGTKLIKNENKRKSVVAKLTEKFNKEKFFYTYEAV